MHISGKSGLLIFFIPFFMSHWTSVAATTEEILELNDDDQLLEELFNDAENSENYSETPLITGATIRNEEMAEEEMAEEEITEEEITEKEITEKEITEEEITEKEILALYQETVGAILDEMVEEIHSAGSPPGAAPENNADVSTPVVPASTEIPPTTDTEIIAEEPITSEEITEKEILALDQETTDSMLDEMIGNMYLTNETAPTMVDAASPIKSNTAVPVLTDKPLLVSEELSLSETDQISPLTAVPSPGQKKLIYSPENFENNAIRIIHQSSNHLLITVGDTVYLANLLSKTLRRNDKYFIYRLMKNNFSEFGLSEMRWYEKIGKLKIIDGSGPITVARIIAAHDVIQKGDAVLLQK
jgi:hypothetical protein